MPDSTDGPVASAMPTQDTLAKLVHAGFSPKRRAEISLDQVRAVLSTLDLSMTRPRGRAPRLRVHRLVFIGEKHRKDGTTAPIRYDQPFSPGVNVVLVPKNGAGKSTILKTIKFALTGDDSDYDTDVRGWIRHVWLHFFLDNTAYTVRIEREEGVRAVLSAGHTLEGFEPDAAQGEVLETMVGTDEMKDTLHQFFVRRLAIPELGWTQSVAGGAEARSASWRTFFQALLVPDSSEGYLLIPPDHSYGVRSKKSPRRLGPGFSGVLRCIPRSRSCV